MSCDEDIQFYMQYGASREDAEKLVGASQALSTSYIPTFDLEDCTSLMEVESVLRGYSDDGLIEAIESMERGRRRSIKIGKDVINLGDESRRSLQWRGEVTLGEFWDALYAEKSRRDL
jgi:hypothetical protein